MLSSNPFPKLNHKKKKKKKKNFIKLSPTVKPRLRRAVITDTFHGPSVPLLTGFDCTKSDVPAVMQNNHSGKYKIYYWLTVQSRKT